MEASWVFFERFHSSVQFHLLMLALKLPQFIHLEEINYCQRKLNWFYIICKNGAIVDAPAELI